MNNVSTATVTIKDLQEWIKEIDVKGGFEKIKTQFRFIDYVSLMTPTKKEPPNEATLKCMDEIRRLSKMATENHSVIPRTKNAF
jgi:hypothetical protein